MTPVDSGGRFYGAEVDDTARSGLASQTITATGNGTAFNAQDIAALRASLTIAGPVTGTGPTLTVTLQHSEDGTNWYTVGSSLPQQTGVVATAVQEEFDVEDFGQLRWSWVAGGTTPSFAGVAISTTVKLTGNA